MEKLLRAIDGCREKILEAERYVWKHPQTGYKEWIASEYLEKEFRALGYELHMAGDIPGFYTVLDTGREIEFVSCGTLFHKTKKH